MCKDSSLFVEHIACTIKNKLSLKKIQRSHPFNGAHIAQYLNCFGSTISYHFFNWFHLAAKSLHTTPFHIQTNKNLEILLTHQVNANWAMPSMIELSGKICCCLWVSAVTFSEIPPILFLTHSLKEPNETRIRYNCRKELSTHCGPPALSCMLRCCHRGTQMSVKTPASMVLYLSPHAFSLIFLSLSSLSKGFHLSVRTMTDVLHKVILLPLCCSVVVILISQ